MTAADRAPSAPPLPTEPIRMGFGRGLLEAGRRNDRVVALCADLVESTQMHHFRDAFPTRFFEVGVAEQNLVTVASGMAAAGTVPFTSSYAAFSPGRNWEQIKTTAALNDRPVKVVGSHAGLNVGPDGATHQMLEDIALMRVMPNMVVVAPADSVEAEKATIALAADPRPCYLRLARDATPVFTTPEDPFVLGKGRVLRAGSDVTLAGTGTMTWQLLAAAEALASHGIDAEVLHFATIKPFDADLLVSSAARTGFVVSAEEAQIAGGFGGLVAETLSEHRPTRLLRLGVEDRYGESGAPTEVVEHFGLTARRLAARIAEALGVTRADG
ncbi:transketolase family protein [Mycetocola reblochoni]|uniref:Transketolase, C-terminal section n=2 Tax=Mycetocola reblochoni TaxID=331618 RepID=A0A1R4IQ75_9MICO|nr:transketolase C-terminal domain-containing protein [Mycetocola reblochoni]RLP68426.1 transketolase family protein [Mycetocola reblochoni]SJN21814.1 Transketolase, C-terminal section [Mycetocola reblochoni REB411]